MELFTTLINFIVDIQISALKNSLTIGLMIFIVWVFLADKISALIDKVNIFLTPGARAPPP
jgi:hypothetical protein